MFIFKFSLKFHRVSSSCEVPDENQMVKEGSDRDAEPHFPPQIIFSNSVVQCYCNRPSEVGIV